MHFQNNPKYFEKHSSAHFIRETNDFINRHFPYKISSYRNFRTITGICIFVFLFLLVFRPFGLSGFSFPDLILRVTVFVVVVFLILGFHHLLLPKLFVEFFSDENWTIPKHVLFTLYIFIVIGICCLFIAHLWNDVPFTFQRMIKFLLIPPLIGIFPISFLILTHSTRLANKHLAEKAIYKRAIPRKLDGARQKIVSLSSENGNERLAVDVGALVLITSADNYVKIYFECEGMVKRKLLRTTLSGIEATLKNYPALYRCHRSYIINLRWIKSIEGNLQGYRVILTNLEMKIPVARSQTKNFKKQMKLLQ